MSCNVHSSIPTNSLGKLPTCPAPLPWHPCRLSHLRCTWINDLTASVYYYCQRQVQNHKLRVGHGLLDWITVILPSVGLHRAAPTPATTDAHGLRQCRTRECGRSRHQQHLSPNGTESQVAPNLILQCYELLPN